MEDGDYKAKLIKDGGEYLQWGHAGQERKPMVNASFELDNGHAMQWTGWLTDAAIDRTVESLKTLGFTGDLTTFNGQEPHGRCSVTVKTEAYKGKSYQKIAFINSGTRRMKEEDRMSAAELKKIAERAQKTFAATGFNPDDPLDKLAF